MSPSSEPSATGQMGEAKRLAYLQAMGVASYFPRIRLPGAPEPILCDNPPVVAEEQAEALPVNSGARDSGVGMPADMASLREGLASAKKPEAKAAVQREVSSADAEALSFTLRFFQVPGCAMIVDSSPASAPERNLQRFAANLMRALGGEVATLKQHVFHWPVAGHKALASDEAAAREAAGAAVRGNCERDGIPLLLLLGESAQRHCEAGDIRVVQGRAIADYLAEPSAKLELWRALQQARGGA